MDAQFHLLKGLALIIIHAGPMLPQYPLIFSYWVRTVSFLHALFESRDLHVKSQFGFGFGRDVLHPSM